VSNQTKADEWTIGYGLDGGGYSLEPATEGPLAELGALIWDDPDWSYLPGETPAGCRGESCLLAVSPNDGHFQSQEWPKTIPSPWEDSHYVLTATGYLNETDRDCDWCGAGCADESQAQRDKCTRCDGDGYVTSPGGDYAAYILTDKEDES
jgi:hypothetical protein